MRHYQRYNNLLGWAVWAIATIVYIACAERTVSWWDCGEYISTASKLMVGHPPGAPTFQILGAIANIFTFGHAEYTAFAINIMSALCSSFTILFLFWTITMIAKKMMEKQHPDGLGTFQQAVIYACGLIGALAYTFSDSFWFSLDGKQIFGTGACNRFFGGYELSENDGIEIGPMGMTKMYCPNIDLEDAFVRALDEADAYSVKGDVLTLSKEGKALASFQGSAMPSQSDGASIDNEGADAATEPAQTGEPAAETGVSAEPAE